MKTALALAFLAVAGCATNQTITYVHPVTGQVHLCQRQFAAGIIPTVMSNNAYADCKNALEEKGFKRVEECGPFYGKAC